MYILHHAFAQLLIPLLFMKEESQNADGKIEMFAGDGSQVTVIELRK